MANIQKSLATKMMKSHQSHAVLKTVTLEEWGLVLQHCWYTKPGMPNYEIAMRYVSDHLADLTQMGTLHGMIKKAPEGSRTVLIAHLLRVGRDVWERWGLHIDSYVDIYLHTYHADKLHIALEVMRSPNAI